MFRTNLSCLLIDCCPKDFDVITFDTFCSEDFDFVGHKGDYQDGADLAEFLAEKIGDAGKVGILGYCWGGLLTWRSAAQLKGLSAAAPYYGGGMTVGDDAARVPTVPVLVHFGDQDHWIPLDTVEAFRRAHPGVTVHVYSANHGFNCDQRGSYNAVAAKLARERTLAFLAEHLG